ncbi:MAG: hypothetical protein A2087_13705 [Spirochaetes bacterium GWD1_61_31]|nr:MAG: hypothetical protein A2Y37_00595 [Spirochaetes bacterium GWB1_60_80]OHD29461.1 MAG: hypothetical protein A2004_03640 [Spirochaetes bacterium GWC1_61_12]OHD43927.1 MAG: hypothetical protein A2087_13705 [Spirochaetes bacterium GWD1_61_31]OHD46207.1 MAG: hypothetical protein A2Y35_00930 [Spirochaetes bacterium GWE1_60_18]OHD60746.1 MAG: hypothetical protein A2Y32_07735 [Spirochaetes bacterium GWF1_60_12]HAP43727.1 transcriptional regulator [Spirochaetaceae bacterium]
MSTIATCNCRETHPAGIQAARQVELPVTRLLPLAELFKLLSDPTRLRLLTALSTGELCVCDLCVTLDMNQSAISHQLALLRHSSLVQARRDGKTVYYSLADHHVGSLLQIALEHVGEERKDRL